MELLIGRGSALVGRTLLWHSCSRTGQVAPTPRRISAFTSTVRGCPLLPGIKPRSGVRQVLGVREGLSAGRNLKVGEVVDGIVVGIQPYGVFVDLGGGQTALLHISQVSRERVTDLNDIFILGDLIKALVNGKAAGRITLSTKKLEPAPGDMLRDPLAVYDTAEEVAAVWRQKVAAARAAKAAAAEEAEAGGDGEARRAKAARPLPYQMGDVVRGVVARVEDYGAYLELAPGIDGFGFVHKSEISDAWVERVECFLAKGDAVEGVVTRIDEQQRRVDVSARRHSPIQAKYGGGDDDDNAVPRHVIYEAGDLVRGVVHRIEPYGMFVALGGGGGLALLHMSQISDARIEPPLEGHFSVGEELKVLVLSCDGKRVPPRITVSTRALEPYPGDMLAARQEVLARAEEMAKKWRLRLQQSLNGFAL